MAYIPGVSTDRLAEFLLVTALIALLDLFPIRMPSKDLYSAGSIGLLYLLFAFDFQSCVFAFIIGTLILFLKESGSPRKIKWFRYFVTLGMFFVSAGAALAVIRLTENFNLVLQVVLAVSAFEIVNSLLFIGIMATVSQASFVQKFRRKLSELALPILVSTVVLSRLVTVSDLGQLLFEVIYNGFFLLVIIFFSSQYFKQIASKEERLEESDQRYKSLYEHNPDAVYWYDLKGKFLGANPATQKILGYTTEDLGVTHIRSIVAKEDIKKTIERFMEAARGVPQNYEIAAHHKDGHRVELNVTNLPIVVRGKIVGVYGIAKDITERKRAEELINHMAYHDALTELPNRRLFKDRLTMALAHAKRHNHRLAVMFLDMDRFKNINDTLGHAVGDTLLRLVAKRLTGCVRKSDTVARMGGDEFTILLSEIGQADDILKIARNILQELEQPFKLEGHEFRITASIGIALYPDDGDDSETLMKHADTAMYRAKESGKNNCQLYNSIMNEESLQQLVMENALRKALEREEFSIYYQPLVDTETGRISGFEALIRWEHPELGLLSPADFIPLAEATGLIGPISEWVLRKACTQNKAWQDAGFPPLQVSVNLSGCQLQEELVETVSGILAVTGLSPGYLQLEITEGNALQNINDCIERLNALKMLGVHIAIDDFGTGYSSLSYLKKFPIDTLKIDKSFVRDVTNDEYDAAIVSTIIGMARSLHLCVIAEGVETQAQLDFLRDQRCEAVQGYLFSRPLPVEECEKLLFKQMKRGRAFDSSGGIFSEEIAGY
ncbi:putative bifunctional diguanylate cyclase/phosphodiesterase [Effusibacillus consociatus]|uniref:Bifunctional diguanylate cyclase/phosphodiesterase n=1 Tax=Effusibacillus consociatus TaxID=1117041 RepID=A0ABV9Q6C0_9BACL